MVLRYGSFLLLIAVVMAVATSTNKPLPGSGRVSTVYDDQVSQPQAIKFSHKFHIDQAGSECIACHPAASTSKFSSDNLLSTKADCATCHDVEDSEDCLKCHVSLDEPGTFIAPARELLFSHDVHVTNQNMACETCHQGLEKVDYATTDNMPSMTTCNTCHNDRQVTNMCESCHTNFVTLVPADHKRSDFLRDHRDLVRLGAIEASCQTCHREETFCQQCHVVTELKSFGRRDLSTERSSKSSTKDSPSQLNLQNVHELNYRLTHGIDARARQSDCASCHSVQTFCADCHSAGGNITQIRFKPASHSVAGFVTLGRGSGGGLHAQEARRDLESCVSCHNVEGQDPTCLTCHSQGGPVR